MKKISLILLLALVSCKPGTVATDASVQEEVLAEFHNSGLAFDGCDTRITVSNGSEKQTEYIVSKATVGILNKLIEAEQAKLSKGDYLYSFPILISFKKNGEKGILLCGWGMKSTVEVIDILKISRKN